MFHNLHLRIGFNAKHKIRGIMGRSLTRHVGQRAASTNQIGSEAGDTLVELLVAIAVLGLVGVALLGGFSTVIGASAEYRSLTTIDSVLKNFAESATYNIQLQTGPAPYPLFTPCAALPTGQATTSTNVNYNGQPISYNPPAGYAITVTGIQYLYQNTSFSSSCDSNQFEPQLITAKATGPKGTSATLSFVVASRQYENSYVQGG